MKFGRVPTTDSTFVRGATRTAMIALHTGAPGGTRSVACPRVIGLPSPRRALGEFGRTYRQAVDDVLGFVTPEAQRLIAVHDLSQHPDRYDMRTYLEASEK